MKEYVIEKTEHQKLLILTDIHICDSVWYHTKNESRMKIMQDVVRKEYEESPVDAILCLGDYSLDFWCWGSKGSYLRTPPVSNTDRFVKEFMPGLPLHPYMIAGNHEQYGHEKWMELTGYPRQYSIVYGDYVILMCDTFGGDLDPTEHSDGTYTGIDPVFLKEVMDAHPDKQLILCLHDLIPEKENEESRKLICESGRVLCAFAGHIHRSNTVILGKDWGSLPVFYCGDFSYSIGYPEGSKPNWGFRRVDFRKGFSTEYQPCLMLASASAPWGQD